MDDRDLTSIIAAPQHGPRPLPLFLEMLRSETAQDEGRRRAALAGLRRYQQFPRHSRPAPPPAIAEAGRARLRDYGGSGRPVVFVPSLINPAAVLDLTAERSLLRWLARSRGLRTLLVDWGTPKVEERGRDIAGHVEDLLLPLLRTLEQPPVLVGYCLGGTMALAAARAARAAAVALIAAPWRFAGFGEQTRADIARLWAQAAPACRALGLVPMEVLQTGFWHLDPARTVAKYAGFANLDPASDAAQAFVSLEDWANGGAPLTYAAGRDLFEELIAADRPGAGAWRVAGDAVAPEALGIPMVEFVSLSDRIVPAATAIGLPDHRALAAGHVGMVIGGRARDQLWTPLADWLNARTRDT